jgi:Family of unknown function (DUF6492)
MGAAAGMSPLPALAILTPSYAADFERCRLLCESLDALGDGRSRHYILVADHDLAQFKPLAGPHRSVIPDSALLPAWLKPVRRPFDSKRRHIWISTDLRHQVRPLSGWHVQQLRKLAASRIVDEDIVVMADSDSVFVRPVTADAFWRDGRVRLYRKPGAIRDTGHGADGEMLRHVDWTRHAARALGLDEPRFPADDFINNLVSWRKDKATEAVARIEAISGLPFVTALGRAASMSEYQIYGTFVSRATEGAGHFDSPDPLSLTYWSGPALTMERARDFVGQLGAGQIAVCVQSFTGTSLDVMRGLIRAGERG